MRNKITTTYKMPSSALNSSNLSKKYDWCNYGLYNNLPMVRNIHQPKLICRANSRDVGGWEIMGDHTDANQISVSNYTNSSDSKYTAYPESTSTKRKQRPYRGSPPPNKQSFVFIN
jgi:hypothetical protein